MSALLKLIPFPGRRASSDGTDGGIDGEARADREEQLEEALAKVRQRWGYGSIVRLDRADALAAAKPVRRPKTEHELPPWWPCPLGPDAAAGVLRPRLLEIVAEPGSGRLTLALAWLAAARPALAAIVDTSIASPRVPGGQPTPEANAQSGASGAHEAAIENRKSGNLRERVIENGHVERFYPPAAATAGLDPRQLIVVRPPAGDPRAPLDAAVILLRSEAFDAVVCPLSPRARVSTSFASKLATFATRANTSLLLLTTPIYTAGGYAAHTGVLASFADYRVRLGTRRWLWEDGELAGMKLRATTERARAASALDSPSTFGSSDSLGSFGPFGGSDSLVAETAGGPSGGRAIVGDIAHDLIFRLHPRARYGPSGNNRLTLTDSRKTARVEKVSPDVANVIVPFQTLATG